MRITRLTIAGFGPYKNAQRVDFAQFEVDGIFLITGKTGAGKSSILDAICYALYNAVPRFEGAQQQLRSDYCEPGDPTFVELEFTVHGTEYRVRRSPEFERPKQRGTGTTRQAATAELFRRTPAAAGVWEGIAARGVDVAHELDRILGLSKDQFLQVILLAQNRFQQFLRSSNDERQAVLRTLFGTKRFEQIETRLTERRKDLEAHLESARLAFAHEAELASGLSQQGEAPENPDLAWFDERLKTLTAHVDAAVAEAQRSDAAAQVADAVARSRETCRRLQERRDAAAQRIAILSGSHDAINADRSTLFAATRAATVWAHVRARRDAELALTSARLVEAQARVAYSAELRVSPSGAPIPPAGEGMDADSLANDIDATTRLLGTLEAVLAEERLLPALRETTTDCRARLSEREGALAQATERSTALPVEIEILESNKLVAQARAAVVDDAVDRVARVTAARTSALLAASLEAKHLSALARERDANGLLATTSATVETLISARISGHAAELASRLVDGEPCAVCGSRQHPAPTTWHGEKVTEEDIDAARARREDAQGTVESTRDVAHDLATRIAQARAKAGDEKAPDLAIDLEAAHDALAEATAAEKELVVLSGAHERLRAELATATSRLEQLRDAKDEAAAQLAEQRSRYQSVVDRVADQRGDEESVAARVTALQGRLDATSALSDALSETRARQESLSNATALMDRQLAEQDFINSDAVVVARRPPVQITALQGRIREHDQSVDAANAILAEPELAGLPTELVEVNDALQEAAAARAARDLALSARSSSEERCDQLRRIVGSARREHAASASLRAEFESVRALAAAIEGNPPNTKRMRLETYVLAAELEEIVDAANSRLRVMTSGRFTLVHDDGLQYRNARSGLGLAILDEHTGRARATHSLSGGETFLASLALALGLAEVVTNRAGGISLDTLFIDEGFGSLDSDTLEIALSTLDSLRAGGRTIGLISHVDTMKEQIAAKLRITVTDHGYSEIDAEPELPPEG